MATISPSVFSGFIASSTRKEPTRTAPNVPVSFFWRFAGSLLGAGGAKSVSGRTYESGAPAARRVVIMTQPPNAAIVYESNTLPPGATFTFPSLAPGNYMVIDAMTNNTRQALVYDWIVAA